MVRRPDMKDYFCTSPSIPEDLRFAEPVADIILSPKIFLEILDCFSNRGDEDDVIFNGLEDANHRRSFMETYLNQHNWDFSYLPVGEAREKLKAEIIKKAEEIEAKAGVDPIIWFKLSYHNPLKKRVIDAWEKLKIVEVLNQSEQ